MNPKAHVHIASCLPGYESLNRFWDKTRNRQVTKILPGELCVSQSDELIATTLGSCISVCLWDGLIGIGGMNHFMLPVTEKEREDVTWGCAVTGSTRYGNFAMEQLINDLLKHGAAKRRLKAKVFGGGAVIKNFSDVGARNIEFVLEYLKSESIEVISSDIGHDYARKVLFEPVTGKAMMKRIVDLHNDTIAAREETYQKQLSVEKVEGEVELF